MEQYKIVGLYYSKPKTVRGADGEALHTRVGVWVTVGSIAEYDFIMGKVVESIVWDENLRQFKVYYKMGGLRIIPYLADTEVTYEEITDNGQPKDNPKKK